MTQVCLGCKVTLAYIGTLDNGRIFASSDETGPLVFTVGAGEVFPALEEGVFGMRPGDCRNLIITAERAYGPRLKENILQLGREAFPAGKNIVVGQKLSIEFGARGTRVMHVAAVSEREITLDGNHPLAGQDLTFAIRLEEVEEPQPEQKEN